MGSETGRDTGTTQEKKREAMKTAMRAPRNSNLEVAPRSPDLEADPEVVLRGPGPKVESAATAQRKYVCVRAQGLQPRHNQNRPLGPES